MFRNGCLLEDRWPSTGPSAAPGKAGALSRQQGRNFMAVRLLARDRNARRISERRAKC
ncbi:hypothetical protein SAMCCGM7_pC0607 (plasmid) [Sinorhizobium americanum CCGM7]|nr:hypothetical protein SAMCCGM7_pC0607 [Sinorhizobium americanum CCGM7]